MVQDDEKDQSFEEESGIKEKATTHPTQGPHTNKIEPFLCRFLRSLRTQWSVHISWFRYLVPHKDRANDDLE